jgi:tetratricopeptide (TPR) repeat protein
MTVAGTTNAGLRELKIPIQMYDGSAAVTMNKGIELLKKGDYEGARQYYDAAIRKNGSHISIALNSSAISENGPWRSKISILFSA